MPSSRWGDALSRLRLMTDDAGVIGLVEGLCDDAGRAEAVAEERRRRMAAMSAESGANARRCGELARQVGLLREADIAQRREIEALRRANEGYRGEAMEWSRRCAALRDERDRMSGELAGLREALEDGGRRMAVLADSYRELQVRHDAALEGMGELEAKLLRAQQILSIRDRGMFGASSEGTRALLGWDGGSADPLDEGAPSEGMGGGGASLAGRQRSADAALRDIQGRMGGSGGGRRARRAPKDTAGRDAMLAGLPNVFHFDYDYDTLDGLYGEGCHAIIGFGWRWEIRETRPANYVHNHYRPIIKVTSGPEEGSVYAEGFEGNFYPGSFASPSLVARVLYKRFCLALPLYRQEQEYRSRGVPVTRQTMSNWILHFCGWGGRGGDGPDTAALFQRVSRRLREELDTSHTVRHCDETTWRVVVWPEGSGRRNASNGYLWEHMSGELSGGHKVTPCVFEGSRGAGHLREYLDGLTAYLVSDAYGAYAAVGRESGGRIAVAYCWMHMRRKMSEAYIATMGEREGLDGEGARGAPGGQGAAAGQRRVPGGEAPAGAAHGGAARAEAVGGGAPRGRVLQLRPWA